MATSRNYDDAGISPSGATEVDDGEYKLTFNAGTTVGTHAVTVTGEYDGRTSTKSCAVKQL